jgi:hypothetical protein
MPNFPITEVPQRISQSLTQPALLQNIGTETIYLDSVSAVGPNNYGLGLVPRSTVNWPIDRELWAVTDTGVSSSISVLYNAEGAGLSEVSAVVSGTIDIGTPVQVQGGGAVLLNTTGSVAPSDAEIVDVFAPANGLTYYGIGVIARVTSKTVSDDAPLEVWVSNFGATPGPTIFQALRHDTTATGYLGEIGKARIGLSSMVVPVGTTFPITIALFNSSPSSTQNFSLQVIGLSYADTYPRDFIQWEDGVEPREVWMNTGAGAYVVLSPSLETRDYLLTGISASAGGNFEVHGLTPTGAWSTTQNRAHNSVYGNVVPAANIATNANSLITIPGNGVGHRVYCANALTGSVTLTYLGKRS